MNTLKPSVPFVWPEPRVMKGMLYYEDPVPFQSLAEKSGSLFGIVYGIDENGVQWLEKLLQKNEHLCCKLIVAVYPACSTTLPALKGLLHIQSSYSEDRVSFRILTTDRQTGAPSNTLCFISSDGSETYYSVGSTPNFGLTPSGVGQVNFVFAGDAILLEAWRNWFDLAWAETAPLNTKTIQIPSLVPAAGTREAAEMWREYADDCKKCMASQHAAEATRENVAIDVETGEISLQSSNGEKKQTLTEKLNVPRLDPLAERISRIYDKGCQVNFSKVGRIPPLDAPIKPEWFGVETLRQVGAISRETKYRISVLDSKTLRNLQNKKKAGSTILKKLSYSLGDNQHWIPHKAIPLFEKELQRVNDDGIKEVYKAFNGQPDAFVDTQIDRIVKDANAMYRDFYPGKTLPDAVIGEILSNLKERLKKASSNKFMPEVSYNSIGFHYQKHSDWVAQWDQPLFLLIQIAEFPRKSVTDSFFLRGLRLSVNELLEAMNVCDDYIVKENKKKNIQDQAREELQIIRDIKESDTDSRKKCEDILALMNGKY
ncbi:MAG: hypothetical protein PHU36_01105 [Syntrophomonadaceae bacterium]|nr:hypothetical protein [Syntrophomonadaceae bacterium]